jgi:hypothetical protein
MDITPIQGGLTIIVYGLVVLVIGMRIQERWMR